MNQLHIMNTYILFLLIIVIWLIICLKVVYSVMDDDDDIFPNLFQKSKNFQKIAKNIKISLFGAL